MNIFILVITLYCITKVSPLCYKLVLPTFLWDKLIGFCLLRKYRYHLNTFETVFGCLFAKRRHVSHKSCSCRNSVAVVMWLPGKKVKTGYG